MGRRLTGMLGRSLAGLLICVALTPAAAQTAQKPLPGRLAFNTIKKGTPYATVRGDMLLAGNVPDYHAETDPD